MTAKEYLKQIKKLDKKVVRLRERVKELEETMDSVRSVTDYDGMPHGSNTGDPTAQRAIQINEAKMDKAIALLDATELKEKIYKEIEAIGGLEAEILYCRYFHWEYSWEQIADEVGYSKRHCTRIHGIALKKFREKYNLS